MAVQLIGHHQLNPSTKRQHRPISAECEHHGSQTVRSIGHSINIFLTSRARVPTAPFCGFGVAHRSGLWILGFCRRRESFLRGVTETAHKFFSGSAPLLRPSPSSSQSWGLGFSPSCLHFSSLLLRSSKVSSSPFLSLSFPISNSQLIRASWFLLLISISISISRAIRFCLNVMC